MHTYAEDTEPKIEGEPATPCEKTIHANVLRYGERYSVRELKSLLSNAHIAAYGNFDPIIEPNGKSI